MISVAGLMDADEGVNPYTQLCNSCDIILCATLESLNDGENEKNIPQEPDDHNEDIADPGQENEANHLSELKEEVGCCLI